MNNLITALSVDISNDPFTGLKRRLIHYRLRIEMGLDMIHDRLLVLYEKIDDGTPEGAYGLPMLDVIENDSNLSSEQKKIKSEQFKSQMISVNTQGVFVNAQGIPTQPEYDEDGNITNGVIPELEFWQKLPLSFIQPAPKTVSDAVYSLLTISMKAQDNQGRV